MPFDFFFFKNKRKPQDSDRSLEQSTPQRDGKNLQKQTSVRKPVSETLKFLEHDIVLVRKAYRRNLSLSVQVNGQIRVSAPAGVTHEKVVSFLCAHEDWLRQHLEKFASLRNQFPQKKFSQGERLLFVGKPLTLKFKCAEVNQAMSKSRLFRENGDLVVVVPRERWAQFQERREHPELIAPIRQFYKKTAQSYLTDRVKFWSERMRLQPQGLGFRSQKTRWGSCNSKGKISLNWRLMIAPIEVIDYVIVHELSHLVHYDHSRAFWNLVAQYIPDYKTHKTWLKRHQYEADFLSEESELHR